MKISIFLITILYLCRGAFSKCVMRGDCITIGGFPKPCPYDEDPLPLFRDLAGDEREEIFRILQNRCPNRLLDDAGNQLDIDQILTCCDAAQLRSIHSNLLMADGILGRCPACVRNFARQICEMNCSPDQARFVNITEAVAPDGTKYVNAIDYRVYGDFMDDAHASCSGVLIPQTGQPAINMMCGNAAVCDADAWFGFTGDTQQNPMAPVQVNFQRRSTTEDSMNVRALSCNESLGTDLPCSCVDCRSSCPTGNEPVVEDRCMVGSVSCIGFITGLVFFALSVSIFVILTTVEYVKLKKYVSNGDVAVKPKANVLTKFFQRSFSRIGGFSAGNPVLIIMITTWIAFSMFFGFIILNITSNPLELWSAPESRSRQELNYFNSRFGPFYRAAQVYLQFEGLESFQVGNTTYGPAFRIEALQELVSLENAIKDIGRNDGGVTLEKVCHAPLRSPGAEQKLEHCVVMSATVYLGEDKIINNDTYLTTIQNCLNNYLSMNCMAKWGGGAEPEISFGGFEGDNILSADTLLINFPISNFILEEDLRPVLDWEQRFLDLLHEYEANNKSEFVKVVFGAERSIEDEIQRVSQAEAIPILISYTLMFVYVILALGNIRKCKTLLVDSKVGVAVGSILVVITAIFCALGVMGLVGYSLTLLAVNVIPFFVLSVGIDNVFLMVNALQDVESNLNEFDDYKDNYCFERKKQFVFEKMMHRVGPSMFVSSITQITCFAIGSLANFPAVVTFAIFASFSLGFLFLFQITTVVAILALDYKRKSQNRFDILCCIKKKILDDEDPLNSNSHANQTLTARLMEPYSKFILNQRVKFVIAIVFMAIFSISIILIPQIEIGLDQEMALPSDSYVYRYLQAVSELLRLGPPVFFVLKSGLNFTDEDHQNAICGGQLCNDDSLITQIFLASLHREITYISRPSNSWLDDFHDWGSLPGSCCKFNVSDNSFCPSYVTSQECSSCIIGRSEFANGLRPNKDAFQKYIPFFLRDTPTDTCSKGGLASYYSNVNYLLDSAGKASVYDTNFMAYHVPLSTSTDYINAVRNGYELSASISKAIKSHTGLDIEVFPYSIFYVYYEQYLTMWKDTFASIGFCLIGALVINLIASGFNFVTSFAMMFTVVMVVVDMMGVMYLWNIPLNAVSCVNLIVSIGIAVEFCSHLAHAYATSELPVQDRTADAIKRVGSTIITGITLTNIPIIVLAFSYTEIIEVFFFRMLFTLVILGFFHGMVFFPILLSYISNIRRQ